MNYYVNENFKINILNSTMVMISLKNFYLIYIY